MEEESNNEIPEVEEIFVSQIDDEGNRIQSQTQKEIRWVDRGDHEEAITLEQYEKEKRIEMNENKMLEEEMQSIDDIQDILNAMDKQENENDIPDTIQDIDYLSMFLKRYLELPEDDYKKSLSILLMRVFLEEIYKVYELNMEYNVEIRSINLTQQQTKQILVLIDELKSKIKDNLLKQYNNLQDTFDNVNEPGDVNDNIIGIFFPDTDLNNKQRKKDAIEMILNIIKIQRNTMKERMKYFSNRFFTALFFTYVLGVNVIPGFTLNNITEEKFKPWNSNYKNVVLFYGYAPSKPEIMIDRREERFNIIYEILNTLNTNEEILDNFCLKTVIELIKGYKSSKTIQKNLQVDEIAKYSSELITNIANLRDYEDMILEDKTENEKKKWNGAYNDLMSMQENTIKPIKNTKRLRLNMNITLEYLISYMRENGLTFKIVENKKEVKLTAPKKGKQMHFKIGLKDQKNEQSIERTETENK